MSHAPKNLNTAKIREMYLEGYCVQAIARKFNCRPNAITTHISDLVIPMICRRRKMKLKDSQIKRIRSAYIEKKHSAPTLSRKYNVSESTILGIIHGKYYRWVSGVVLDRYNVPYYIPENNFVNKPLNTKGALKRGPNKHTERLVNTGMVKQWAKKYKVSPSTISKWLRNGKLDLTGRKRSVR